MKGLKAVASLAVLWVMVLCGCTGNRAAQSGQVLDEARQAGRAADTFPAADEDYFHDMDGALALTANEVKGRNNWIVWTGGNDRFWDLISGSSFGSLDFLKTISSHPSLKFSRDNRWHYLGLVNEPCYEKASGPDANRFGLWARSSQRQLPT